MDNNGVSLKIESDAKSADNQLEQLISLLTKTNTLISKIKGNNGITSVAKDTQNTNDKLNKTNTLLKGMNDKLKMPNLRSWASSIRQITGYLTSMVQQSSAYIENLNLLQVAFGDSYTAAQSFVNGLADIYGLDESTLTRYLAYYRNFGRTLGIAADKADMLSKNLLKMQLDISSLYNLSFQESGQKLLSALAGQTKPIRSGTGADITQSTLQMTLDKMGIDKTAKELTRAEKVITIYLSLVDQLSSAQGDLARTINSPANQMKIFSEQVTRAARNLGNLFLPVLTAVLPWLNGLLMVFSELVETLMGFLGIDVAGFWDSMSTGDTSTIDDLTNSLDDTSEAADKATKSLRGFDKLNVINTPTKDTGDSTIGGVDSRLLDALDEYDLKLSNIKNKATDIRDRIMGWLGFTKDTNAVTGEITWTYQGFGTTIKNIWGWFKELNEVTKLFILLALGDVMFKIFTIGVKILKLIGKTGLYKELTLLLTPIKNLEDSILKVYKKNNSLNDSLKKGTRSWSNHTTNVNKAITALEGLAIAYIGISFITDSFKSIAEEGLNFKNVFEGIVGILALVAGAIVVVTAVVGTMTVSLALATGGISLIVGLFAAIITASSTASNNTNEYTKSLQKLNDQAKIDVDTNIVQVENTKTLVAEMGNLVDANGKVKTGYEDRVTYILSKVNDAFGTEYSLIDGVIAKNGDQIKSYGDVEAAIDTLIEKKKTEIILEAYKDEYVQALKNQKDMQKDINEIQQTHNDDLLEANGNQLLINIANEKYNIKLQDIQKQYDLNKINLQRYEDLEAAYATGNMARVDELMKNYYDSSTETYDALFTYADTSTKNAKTAIEYNLGNIKLPSTVLEIGVDVSKASKTLNEFGTTINSSSYSKSFGITFPTFPVPKKNVSFQANGGFVEQGEMFIAREAGAEMVGQIGNKTAVANNDQIVDSISNGVYRALVSSNFGSNGNTIIEVSEKGGILDHLEFKQKQKDRQYGL